MGIRSRLSITALIATSTFVCASLYAADNLKLNQHLDYTSDSQDGPLITGDNLSTGPAAGKPNYIIIYAEGCFNSKQQARRTVNLYQRYRDRVNFVIVDLDQHPSTAQQPLLKSFYKGYIPTVVVIDSKGATLYSRAGEEDEAALSRLLDQALQ